MIAGKVNPFIYHYKIEVRLDEKNSPAEKKIPDGRCCYALFSFPLYF